MYQRSYGQSVLTLLVLLVLPLCLPGVVSADDEAEVLAACAEGEALRQKGDYPGAAKAYGRAVELAQRAFGPEHESIGMILNNQAFLYQVMGQYAQAEPLYQRSLKIKESQLGPNHPDVARSLNNLAHLYDSMGQYVKAEPLLQRSVRIRESKLGPDHSDVALSLNNLALLYDHMGQYAKAEPLYQRSLKIDESQFGPDHPRVATSLNNLAALYRAMGQYARAERLYQRSLQIFESKLGPDHPEVATSLNNLAILYSQMGQYAKMEPLYQRSLKIWESKLGPDHPDVAVSLNNLAALYDNLGQYAKAEPLLQRSLKINESQLGPDHPEVARSLHNLAALYNDMSQYLKAEPLLQRSLKIWESKLGPDHPDVALSLNSLAGLYNHMGQYAKMEPLYQRSLKINESQLGPDHPTVALSLNNLALLYDNLGQYAKAEPLLQRSLKINESHLGPDHPKVALSLNNLAELYAATHRWSEAIAQTERARRIVRRHVASTLPALSEREQLVFLQTQDELFLHMALSLGLQQRAHAQSAQRSAGWVLNGKAVAQEVLAQRAILASEETDPAVSDLIQQLLTVRSRLASLSLTLPRAGQEADYRQQVQTLGQHEQELSRQVGQATGRNTRDGPWIEPAAVCKALTKGAVLVDVARFRDVNFKDRRWLPPHYAAWLIPAEEQGQILIVDLGEAQKIDVAVQTARQALEKATKTIDDQGEAKAEKQLREAMQDLARLVFEPLETPLGNARELIVSPDAALWLVPWGALPLRDGKYAIEKYQIRYMVSGRDLVSQATTKTQSPSDPILFANPDYDLGPGEANTATRAVLRSAAPVEQVASSRGLGSLSGLPKVQRLPGTAEEAAAVKPGVARYAGVEPTVYEDQYALEGVFKALHRPRVLVLSTHGFFMPDQEVAYDERSAGLAQESSRGRAVLTTEGKPRENPLLRCGLLLAGCNHRAQTLTGVDDGVLTGLEIVGTDLRGTELVVLSACETGLGQVRNGEGVAGLRQAFQLAGAQAVLATLWQIPDEETVELMNAFFSNLSSRQSKADALHNAQLSVIKARRAANGAAHPYYWAAFTLTGQ